MTFIYLLIQCKVLFTDGEHEGEEKKDPEKPEVEELVLPEEEEEMSEEQKWIEETYPPIIVTAHQDSYIRFWSMDVCTCTRKVNG